MFNVYGIVTVRTCNVGSDLQFHGFIFYKQDTEVESV